MEDSRLLESYQGSELKLIYSFLYLCESLANHLLN